MNISVFGLGYVGTVATGCLATLGHRIIGVDVHESKVRLLDQGKSPIVEKQISDILAEQYKRGNISATLDACRAVNETEVSFLCVGTPPSAQGHLSIDALFKVARQIAAALIHKNTFHVIAIRSTVPPGTASKLAENIAMISGRVPDRDFAIVSNPEFLREGTAVKDFFEPSYTVLASSSSRAITIMKELYEDIAAPVVVTDVSVAEMIKYVSNAFHALKVVFANEVGNICSHIGVDSHKLMRLFCMDTKLNLSSYYLRPGFSYGGSCLPKDLKALTTIAHDMYVKCPVLENVHISNEMQKDLVLQHIISFGKPRVGFLGLSFKAGTDDLRSSPIVDVLEKLIGKGFDVMIYDKNVHLSQLVGTNKEFILQRIPLISRFIKARPQEVIEQSDVIVVVNDDVEFHPLISSLDDDKILYDLVNTPHTRNELTPVLA